LPELFFREIFKQLSTSTEVEIPFGGFSLAGELSLAPDAAGLVIFAHGSGSSRHSPRNQFVAHTLQARGLGTLLFDLLTAEEERQDLWTRGFRFDIELLAQRLLGATAWAWKTNPKMPLGYFGASTGAAAALVAASKSEAPVKGIVSRGGRPDLAGDALEQVKASTLLIIGNEDTEVISLNEGAFARLHCVKELKLIPGATHLFEEPGALEQVSELAAAWFEKYLPS
jgi:alpha-beta hydrolase superfamily lysophospholipase